MDNDGAIPIYTQANWGCLMYLWPHPASVTSIVLYPDTENGHWQATIAKLKRTNPYLANLIETQGEGHIVLRKAFKEAPSKRTYGR